MSLRLSELEVLGGCGGVSEKRGVRGPGFTLGPICRGISGRYTLNMGYCQQWQGVSGRMLLRREIPRWRGWGNDVDRTCIFDAGSMANVLGFYSFSFF